MRDLFVFIVYLTLTLVLDMNINTTRTTTITAAITISIIAAVFILTVIVKLLVIVVPISSVILIKYLPGSAKVGKRSPFWQTIVFVVPSLDMATSIVPTPLTVNDTLFAVLALLFIPSMLGSERAIIT